MAREDTQLYYQIALIGRRDFALAPDARTGIEMILLRMLAFRPARAATPTGTQGHGTPQSMASKPSPGAGGAKRPVVPAPRAATPNRDAPMRESAAPETEWESTVNALGLTGMARVLASNCTLEAQTPEAIRLLLDEAHAHLRSAAAETRLEEALRRHFSAPVRLEIAVGTPQIQTPAKQQQRRDQNRLDAAIAAIEGDAEVKRLQETFNARIIPDTIQPVD
jgi:DNA polymerase-3 subunit gamma/tau